MKDITDSLTRLKTYRVVPALFERGIVTMEKYENTNQVSLVKWFHEGNASTIMSRRVSFTLRAFHPPGHFPLNERRHFLSLLTVCARGLSDNGKVKVCLDRKMVREIFSDYANSLALRILREVLLEWFHPTWLRV